MAWGPGRGTQRHQEHIVDQAAGGSRHGRPLDGAFVRFCLGTLDLNSCHLGGPGNRNHVDFSQLRPQLLPNTASSIRNYSETFTKKTLSWQFLGLGACVQHSRACLRTQNTSVRARAPLHPADPRGRGCTAPTARHSLPLSWAQDHLLELVYARDI